MPPSDKIMSDTRAFLDTLATRPEVRPSKIGVTGYCMGGRFSLMAAGTFPERIAVAAGLHLFYDDLDGSHSLSQTVEGRGKNHNGDYWHAIMHRREPDYDNAKYWFRRVGAHPVMTELPAVLERIRKELASRDANPAKLATAIHR